MIDKNNKLKISVITVVRNGELSIRKAIESVISQSYSCYEYIIVDGASTDRTLEIISEYKSHITKLISEPDDGISDAFNKGVSNASGDVLTFVNADDWLEPNAFEIVANQVRFNNLPTIYHGNMNYADSKCRFIRKQFGDDTKLRYRMTLNFPTVYISRNCYSLYGLFDLDYKIAMDYNFLLRAYKSGANFQKIDATLSNMRIGGVSDRNWKNGLREVYKSQNSVYGFKFENTVVYLYTLAKVYARKLMTRFFD